MLLDLCHEEDYQGEVDFNVVMTDKNDFVEIQGTAEGNPSPKKLLLRCFAWHRRNRQIIQDPERNPMSFNSTGNSAFIILSRSRVG